MPAGGHPSPWLPVSAGMTFNGYAYFRKRLGSLNIDIG
jgi:hypothetical protein